MLFTILLAVIAKLAMASSDCKFHTTNKTTDWIHYTGKWYWLYHVPNIYEENMDCPISTFKLDTRNSGTDTLYVYMKSTKTQDQLVGNVQWNSTLYKDVIFPTTSNKDCPAGASCTKNPSYASLFNGRYYVVSADYKRYYIYQFCCTIVNTPCIYVLFRSPNPDEGTLSDVKKDLADSGLDFNQLAKVETNYCQSNRLP